MCGFIWYNICLKGTNYAMTKRKLKEICTKDKEVDVMPTIELIEHERVTYVKEMQDYLQNLKRMNKREAQKKSFNNLVQSEIIHTDGEFTERYKYTKQILQKKG